MIYFLHFILLLFLPVLLLGCINRTKALWGGRKGPPLLQTFYDLRKLLRKKEVVSSTSGIVFALSGPVFLATSILATLIVPIFPHFAPWTFPFDFVFFLYLFATGRFFLALGALDTGSSFEGMGASRAMSFAPIAEVSAMIAFGGIAIFHGSYDLIAIERILHSSQPEILVSKFLFIFLFFLILQLETSRMPVDDPNTHLELTMVHEVMVLDHSGANLAAIQYGSGIRLALYFGIIACLLNPVALEENLVLSAIITASLMVFLSILQGTVESLFARMRMLRVFRYTLVGLVLSVLCAFFISWGI